jgi:hypothetical protein
MGSGWAWVGHRKGRVQSKSKTKLFLINYLGALGAVQYFLKRTTEAKLNLKNIAL